MTLRVGVVGLGRLGTYLAGELSRHPDVTLAAVADVDPEALERAGEAVGVPPDRRHDECDRMLESAALDAVCVATPHALHYEQVVAALERGLDVLCEKPLVIKPAHARDLVARDTASDAVLMVGYQRHVEPPYRLARERWAGAAEPTFVTAEITEDWLDGNVGTWRVDPDLSGGGFLFDTGSHVIDGVLWTTGLQPTRVTANMDFYAEGIDVRASLLVEFAGGATANISFHGDVPRTREHVHIWDDDGAIYIDGREWGPRTMSVVDGDGTVRSPPVPSRDSAYERPPSKVDAFVEVVRHGTEPPATARDALRAAIVREAAYDSAREGEPVAVEM